jgi:hypothetical protein
MEVEGLPATLDQRQGASFDKRGTPGGLDQESIVAQFRISKLNGLIEVNTWRRRSQWKRRLG